MNSAALPTRPTMMYVGMSTTDLRRVARAIDGKTGPEAAHVRALVVFETKRRGI